MKRKITQKRKKELTKQLEKARAARKKPSYAQYNQDVVNLPEDHPLAFNTVRGWVKEAQERARAYKREHNHGKVKGALYKATTWESYANQCESYLKHGTWISVFQGPNMEKKTKYKCIAMGYYPEDSIYKGKPKRDIGCWYPDVRREWTLEDEELELKAYGVKIVAKPKAKKRKRKSHK